MSPIHFRFISFIVLFISKSVFADLIISKPQVGSMTTSTTGNVQITQTGAISESTKDAMVVDAKTNIVLDSHTSEMNREAILVTNFSSNGIHIVAQGANSTLTIGANRQISAVGNGILVEEKSTAITNEGVIISTAKSAIQIGEKGINTTLYNKGLLQNQTPSQFALLVDGQGTRVENSGEISSLFTAVSLNQSDLYLSNHHSGKIVGFSDGVSLSNQNISLDNKGLIASGNSGLNAIVVRPTAKNISIVNQREGVIQGGTEGILIEKGATQVVINNSGRIFSNQFNGIKVLGDFNSITNNVGGTIGTSQLGKGSYGIFLAQPTSGNIINDGTIITAKNGAAAIYLSDHFNGSIINNASGKIQTIAGGKGDALFIKGAFLNIDNRGIIEATTADSGAITISQGSHSGTINNAGIICSQQAPAILLEGDMRQINNTGTISNQGGYPTLLAQTNALTLEKGIVNNGNIINQLGNVAVSLAGASDINIPFIQNSGTIKGNVILNSHGGTVLTMNGGTIEGAVVASSGKIANILNLVSGKIAGKLTLGNGNEVVNLSGTHLDSLVGGAGNNTFNISGGYLNALDAGKGGVNVLNVNGPFLMHGVINNLSRVHVQPFGQFNMLGAIHQEPDYIIERNGTLNIGQPMGVGLRGDSLFNKGSMQIKEDFTFKNAITNQGTLLLGADNTLRALSFSNEGEATYQTQIHSPDKFGLLLTDFGKAALAHDSHLSIKLTPDHQFIPRETTFDIIQAKTIDDHATLVQPHSAILFFEKSDDTGAPCAAGNCVRLTAKRNRFSSFSTEVSQELAQVLDSKIDNFSSVASDKLFTALTHFDLLSSANEVQAGLESLAPPSNNALSKSSQISMNMAFQSVHQRLEDLQHLHAVGEEKYILSSYKSYNYRDNRYKPYGVWFKGYGAILDQHTQNQIKGYLGDATGIALGGDREMFEGVALGAATSYTNTHVKGKAATKNVQDIKSWQFTLYSGWTSREPLYVDMMFGLASHQYRMERNILLDDFASAAVSQFKGSHYGAEIESGYAFSYNDLIVAPLAQMKFTHLKIGSYSESNNESLGLSVQNEDVNELLLGAGFRMARKLNHHQVVYVPELRAMLLYDLCGDREKTTSQFLTGEVFHTKGAKNGRSLLLFDVGMNTHSSDNYTFSVKYELALREQYFGHSGYLQLRYHWD